MAKYGQGKKVGCVNIIIMAFMKESHKWHGGMGFMNIDIQDI